MVNEVPINVTIDPAFGRLYGRQRDVQVAIKGVAPVNLPDVQRMEYITEMALGLISEINEALAETGWKSWASSNHVNTNAFRDELADAYLFLMNLLLAADIPLSVFAEAVSKKQDKTVRRIKEGYTGMEKCPACQRAYDDDAVTCTPVNVETSTPAYCGVLGTLSAAYGSLARTTDEVLG